MNEQIENPSTRERLIEVAGELFAEKGFKETTIREICEKAEANVAAVNYHFRDKENLYHEVVQSIVDNVKGLYSVDQTVNPADPPGERLHQFCYALLMRRFDPDRAPWRNIIFYKEILEPRTNRLQALHDERAKDQQALEKIIHDLVGVIDVRTRFLVSMSIVGQCLFYTMVHAPHSPIPENERIPMNLEMIKTTARHIADFSLAGISRLRSEQEENR